jgi:hypothetical protein
MVMYFAYNDEVSKKRISNILNYIPNSQPVILENHKLSFRKESENSCYGKADIFRRKGFNVYGSLYEIKEEDLILLENCKNNIYETYNIKVKNICNDLFNPLTFVMKKKKNLLKPNNIYLNNIIKGLKENQIDKGYISSIIQIGMKRYNDNNEIFNNDRSLERICEGDLFSNKLNGLICCKLSYTKKINCEFHKISDEPMENKESIIYVCKHPFANMDENQEYN